MFNEKASYKVALRLIKQLFIVLLSFSGSSSTKCMFLNNETCMIRPTLMDLNSWLV